mgnify:CR=1 FL=1
MTIKFDWQPNSLYCESVYCKHPKGTLLNPVIRFYFKYAQVFLCEDCAKSLFQDFEESLKYRAFE